MISKFNNAAPKMDNGTKLLCAVILLAPLASGARGLDPALGRALIAAIDAALIVMFLRNFVIRMRTLETMIAAVMLYCFFQWAALIAIYPGLEPAFQGFRKTLLILLAVSIGARIRIIQHGTVKKVIVFTLFYVCLYGIKQYFVFSDFDRRLLDAQSAGLYTNMIDDKIRALSLLSGPFHLGAAACALASYAAFAPFQSKWRKALVWVVALAACYAAISRTFLLLILSVPLLTYMMRDAVRFIVCLYLLAFALLVTEYVTGGAVSQFALSLSEDSRLLNRASSYTGFATYWQTNPLNMFFGFGLGSAGSALSQDFLSQNIPWIESHNIYLKYLFELGALGGTAILVIFAWVVRSALKNSRDQSERAIIVALVLTTAIAGLTLTPVETWPVNWFIGILIGMAYCPKPVSLPVAPLTSPSIARKVEDRVLHA